MSYSGSMYGDGAPFIPQAPGATTSSASREDPVVPSPARGAPALSGAWHPGGPGFLRGGGADPAWMAFGEPNARGPVFPPAQQPWARGANREQHMYGGYGYGTSPYAAPMTVQQGPSPYLAAGAMMPDPYYSHGRGHHGAPAPTPQMGMNMGMAAGMPMGMPGLMPAYATPGMYPHHMMGGWSSPEGLPHNLHEPEMAPASLRGRLGRNFDQAVFVDKWEAGKHYGPVLDARVVSILKPKFEVNPLLQAPSMRDDREYIEWNMLFPENSAHLSSEPHHQSWRKGRDTPAVLPRTDTIMIISPFFPWTHTIKSNRGKALTCGDLLRETFKFLHTYSLPEEYNLLQKVDPARHRAVYQNWQLNRSRGHRDVPGGSLPEGMLKADFLLINTMFEGFVIDETITREKLGVSKGKNDRKRGGLWRDGQGGNGMCVLVLMCGPRPGLSVEPSPHVRGSDLSGRNSQGASPAGLTVPV